MNTTSDRITTVHPVVLDYTSRTRHLGPAEYSVTLTSVEDEYGTEGHRIVIYNHEQGRRQVSYIAQTWFRAGHTTQDAVELHREIVQTLQGAE